MQNVGQECGIPSVIINHRLWDERGSLFRDKNLPRDENAFWPPFCLAFFIQPHSLFIQTAREQNQFFSLKQMSPSKGSIFCHGKYARAWYLQKLICYRNTTTIQRKYWQKSQHATERLPAIQSSLGPGLAVEKKGKIRGQIRKIELHGILGRGNGQRSLESSMIPDCGVYLWLVKFLHVDRFAVLLTVSRSFNITLLQFGKRFFKTQVSSKQYKFVCETFHLSLGSKKSKKYAYDLLQKEKEVFKIWSFSCTILW